MALIHLNGKFSRMRAMCGRAAQHHSYNEAFFIELYIKNNGKNFCSKCAGVLINQKKLVAAENTITDDTKELIGKLTVSSKKLHDEYIEHVRKYADLDFDQKVTRISRSQEEWDKEYEVQKEVSKYSRDNALSYKYDRSYYKMKGAQERLESIIKKGKVKFIEEEVISAERHYNDSIRKLADRIEEQSLNVKKMIITYGKVRENGIDTVITDGVNTVNAWTIIAALESKLMKPHYRYLIK